MAAYRQHSTDKGNSPRQIGQAVRRCECVFDGCRCRLLAELDASAAERWLAGRREAPKSAGGISPQTSNHYTTSLKAFGNWLVQSRRVAEYPFRFLTRVSVDVDIRRVRWPLTAEEFARLPTAAAAGRPYRGVKGPDRVVLYAVAAFTGLWAAELASPLPASYALDRDPPTVTVAAAYSKHRREDVVPLHPALVNQLRPWLMDRSRNDRLWPGKWASQFTAAAMLRKDLAAARHVWLAEAGTPLDRADRERSDFLSYVDADGGRPTFTPFGTRSSRTS